MPTAMTQYVDPTWGFTFEFPADWRVDNEAAPGVAAVVVGPAGHEGFKVNVVGTIEESVGELDEWRETSERLLAESIPLFAVIDRNRVEASDRPAIISTVTFAGPNAESVTQLIWSSISDGDIGFCLTASCSTVDFPTYAGLFEQILMGCEPPQRHASEGKH